MRSRWIVAPTMALALLLHLPASATDNLNPTLDHWHSTAATFRVHSTSLDSAQRTAVQTAGSNWPSSSKLTLSRGADFSGGVNWADSATHLVWQSPVPDSWSIICTTDVTACSRIAIYASTNDPFHISDADTLLNNRILTFTTSDATCSSDPTVDTRRDITTVMLHEFGHWGRLEHTSDPAARMWSTYSGCRRTTTLHDRNSMYFEYVNAGH